ncbi:hypothetical protein L2E82_15493 [Cichorium intybus]|uniref:Uncharacterized protein n=1 Tax=Cichorium intybus TaxID=13427 RepID=A0ACB9F2G2_CICIN|nr:hypothetical protein L2E82_15493 [Cichorium intybus]
MAGDEEAPKKAKSTHRVEGVESKTNNNRKRFSKSHATNGLLLKTIQVQNTLYYISSLSPNPNPFFLFSL